MKNAFTGAILLVLALPSGALSAQVFRCSDSSGVTFQQAPCAADAKERTWEIPVFPAANHAERERLLRREAALDARLAKRAEIEAAERIAREARLAREAELQADRERVRAAAEPVFAIPVFVQPYRPRPYLRRW